MKKILFLLLLCAFPGISVAQETDARVVKADSGTVYFDITLSSGAVQQGSAFTIFEEGEELVSPVTGAGLGRVRVTVATGTVTEVRPKYAVGRVEFAKSGPKPGQAVAWRAAAAPPRQEGKTPLWKSGSVPGRITGIALGDINGDGRNELAAAAEKVTLYDLKENQLKTAGEWEPPDSRRILSIDAADLKGAGKAQIFVSAFSEFSNIAETYVLEFRNGKFEKTETFGRLVRNVPAQDGKARLYSQELFDSQSLDRSGIREISYSGGRFSPGPGVPEKPRPDWIYGFNLADFNADGKEDLVYITESNKLRVQFEKRADYWESSDEFGRTPNRFRWKDKSLRVYPRVPVIKNRNGDLLVYAIVNIPKQGLLSESFGLYKAGELRCYKWSGSELKEEWKSREEGYETDIQYGKLGDMPPGLIVSEVTAGDRSLLSLFEP